MKIYRSLKQQDPSEEAKLNVQGGGEQKSPISKFLRSDSDRPINPVKSDIDPTTGRAKLDLNELGKSHIRDLDFWRKNATIPESSVDLNYIDDESWDKIKKYNLDPVQLSQDQLQNYLAGTETHWSTWWKSNLNPLNMTTNVLGNLVKNVGLVGALATEWGDNRDYKNWLTDVGDWTTNLISDDIKLKPEHEGSLKGIGSPKWWLKNVVGIADEATSFAITGGATGAITKGLVGLATRGLARTAVTAARINDALTRGSTAATLSYLEGASSGAQVFDQIYNHQLTNATLEEAQAAGFDNINDYAKHKAAIGASTTVQINTALNTLLNLTSVAPLTRSSLTARNTALGRLEKRGIGEGVEKALVDKLGSKPISQLGRDDIIGLANPVVDQSKNSLLRGLNKAKQEILPSWNKIKNGDAGYLGEAFQESIEESINYIAEKTGEKAGKANDDYSFLDAFANMEVSSVLSDEGAFSAVLGAFGGIGNTAFVRHSPLAGWFSQPVYKTDDNGDYVYKKAVEGQKADADGFALDKKGNRIKELEDSKALFGKRLKFIPKTIAGRQLVSTQKKEEFENARTLKRVLASVADDIDDLKTNLDNLNKVVNDGVDLDGNKVDAATANRIADNIKANLFSSRAYTSIAQGNGEYLAAMLDKLADVDGTTKIRDLLTPQIQEAQAQLVELQQQAQADPDNETIKKAINTYEGNIQEMTDEITKYGHLTPLEKRGMTAKDIKNLKRSAARVRELSGYYNSMMERYDWGDEETSLLAKKLFALKSSVIDAEDRISDVQEKIDEIKGKSPLDISKEDELANLYTSLYQKNEIIKNLSSDINNKYEEFQEAVNSKDFNTARKLEKQIRDLTGNWVDPIDPAFISNYEQNLLVKAFNGDANKKFNAAVDDFITFNNPELIDASRDQKNNWALAEISDRLANNDLLDSYHNELAYLEIQRDKFNNAIRAVNSSKGRKSFVTRTLAQFEELFKDYEDTSDLINSSDPLAKVKKMTAQINQTIKDLEKVLDVAVKEYTVKKVDLEFNKNDITSKVDQTETEISNSEVKLSNLEESQEDLATSIEELKIHIDVLKQNKEELETKLNEIPEDYGNEKQVVQYLIGSMFKSSDGLMYKLRSMPNELLEKAPDIQSKRGGKSYTEILNNLKDEFDGIESEELQRILNDFIIQYYNINKSDISLSAFKDSELQEELNTVINSIEIIENQLLPDKEAALTEITQDITNTKQLISDSKKSLSDYNKQLELVQKEYNVNLEKLNKALDNKQRRFGKALENALRQKEQLTKAAENIQVVKDIEEELEYIGVDEETPQEQIAATWESAESKAIDLDLPEREDNREVEEFDPELEPTVVSDIEAKIADIEKRRKTTFDTFNIEKEGKKLYEYYLTPDGKTEEVYGETEQEVKDKINAKYDAELAALGKPKGLKTSDSLIEGKDLKVKSPEVATSIDRTGNRPIVKDSALDNIRKTYAGGKQYFNVNMSGLEVADNLRMNKVTPEELFSVRNNFGGKLYNMFERGFKSMTGKSYEEYDRDLDVVEISENIKNKVKTTSEDIGAVTINNVKPDYIVQYNNQAHKVVKVNVDTNTVSITNLSTNENIEVPVSQLQAVVADASLEKLELLELLTVVENSMFPKEFFEKFILRRINNINTPENIVRIAKRLNSFLNTVPDRLKLSVQNEFNNKIRFVADWYQDKIKNQKDKNSIMSEYSKGSIALRTLVKEYNGMPDAVFGKINIDFSKVALEELNKKGGLKYVQIRWDLSTKNADNRVYEFVDYEHKDDGLYYTIRDAVTGKERSVKSDYIYDPLDQVTDRTDSKENLFDEEWLLLNGISGSSAFDIMTDEKGNRVLVPGKGESVSKLSTKLNNAISNFLDEANKTGKDLDEILGDNVEIIATKQLATNKNLALRRVISNIELLSSRQVETYLNMGQLYANPNKMKNDRFIAISTWTDIDLLIAVNTGKDFELTGYLRNPNAYRLIEKDAQGIMQDRGVYHPGIILDEYEQATTKGKRTQILKKFNELYMDREGQELTEKDLITYGNRFKHIDKIRNQLINKFNSESKNPNEDVLRFPYSSIKDILKMDVSAGLIDFVDVGSSLDERYDDLAINNQMFIYDSGQSAYTIGSVISNVDLSTIKDLDPKLLDKPNYNSRYWLLFKDHNGAYRRSSLKPKDASNELRSEVYEYFQDLAVKYKGKQLIPQQVDDINREMNEFLLSKIFIQLPKIGKNFSMLRFYLNPDREGNVINQKGDLRLGIKITERIQRAEGTVWLDSSNNTGKGGARKYVSVTSEQAFYSTLQQVITNISSQNSEDIKNQFGEDSEILQNVIKFKQNISDYKIGPNLKVSVPKDLSKMSNKEIASLFFVPVSKAITRGKRLMIYLPDEVTAKDIVEEKKTLVGKTYIKGAGDQLTEGDISQGWAYKVTGETDEYVEFDTYKDGKLKSSNKMTHEAFTKFVNKPEVSEKVETDKYGIRTMLSDINEKKSSEQFNYIMTYLDSKISSGDDVELDTVIELYSELNAISSSDLTEEELDAKYEDIVRNIEKIEDLKKGLC